MPGWDVTVRPGKEEKKKDDNTWVIVVVLLALLLLLLYGGGQHGVRGWGTGHDCVQRDGSRCDQGSGSGGHRDGRRSGHDGEDRDPRDRRGP
ncbi:MAG TPA: hypothetical protein VGP96_04230 [Candidatus Dormibacteraeota bacterium]|jgi:hypothetical protein|nr:hypothetical protein [Candidatus Dormibacteraeota bacterium]